MVNIRLLDTSSVETVKLDHSGSKNCIRPRRRRRRGPRPPVRPPSFGPLHLEPAADDVLLRIKEAQERLNFEIRRQYSLCEEAL
ncbi:unnamed protein product [Rotaria magnacalcarata]|uniref:Uncharacterized protein n=1 Tax=Rotaria magnacalcarata TaxID=392030 RepID=A0A815XAA6_9BILA|nr:unnamed protein product [Rotaria magnacalcarata]CAF1664877.1 unnamed protein product [Rotaria magnacalcarata]CAF2059770.1 unnamed protein product [Rotaria magnacalcarata]CAF4087830.1 unnamed protein product [Rotaria magnacalcarata]CAF4111908.1 unnamed protein product [Rotaria magnacalcarata]